MTPVFHPRVFPILVPGKSKGLNHLSVYDKGISYLGATNLNNGVLDFVSPVGDDNEIDWDYMENYMKAKEQKAILCYLHQIQTRHKP